MSECDEIAVLNKCAIDAVGLLQSMRSLLPSRNGPINSADLIENAEQSQFLHVAATLLSEFEQLQQLVSSWPSLSQEASYALDLASVSLGDAEFANHVGCNTHELAFDLAKRANDYFCLIDSVRWGLVEPIENMQQLLQQCDEAGEEHVIYFYIPNGDFQRLAIRLRHEAALARTAFVASATAERGGPPPNGNGQVVTSFVPTDLQRAILRCLDGKALKVQAIATTVCNGERTRLYKPGGIKELKDAGLVDHKHQVGYFRPDAPPPIHDGK